MKEVKFRNKNGTLTYYAFLCGYVMDCEPRPDVSLQMWMEHTVFSVRAHDRENGRLFWENFESNEMTKAKRFYAAKKKELANQRLEPALSKEYVTNLEPVLGGMQ